MSCKAIAFKEGNTSPYYVCSADTVQEALQLLNDNATLDNFAFVEIRVNDFNRRFWYGEFTRPEDYMPL